MDRQWTVAGAAALLSLENVAVLGGLLFRGHTSIVLLGVLLLKFPLCRALLRLRIGAAAVLVLWESVTMLVALVNLSIAPPAEVALFVSASTGSTLIALSLPLFAPQGTE
ncbi:MAG TPA: hypothetical protein VGR20_16000 [Acidimicrobiia bacterium]|jgi:hypothetical protein|nr:hypothetical protein [Acidimicrobiia bacterium]